MSILHGKEDVQQMIFDGQPTPALAARCRQLVSAKYRIDDWLDAGQRLLRRRFWDYRDISSDIDDWLEDLAQNPALDDKQWLAERYPERNPDIDEEKAPRRRSLPGFGRYDHPRLLYCQRISFDASCLVYKRGAVRRLGRS